ncbi:MAG: hypothetical protein IJ043_00500 [Clostridia bacterium]|nr:hypothetical protein [Clostridia bacterium]
MKRIRIAAFLLVLNLFLLLNTSCNQTNSLKDQQSLENQFVIESMEDKGKENRQEAEEKDLLYIDNSKIHFSEEQLIQMSELIIKGTVISNDGYIMANPDETKNIRMDIMFPMRRSPAIRWRFVRFIKGNVKKISLR